MYMYICMCKSMTSKATFNGICPIKLWVRVMPLMLIDNESKYLCHMYIHRYIFIYGCIYKHVEMCAYIIYMHLCAFKTYYICMYS